MTKFTLLSLISGVLLAVFLPRHVFANELCSVEVETYDTIKFSTNEITVNSQVCPEFKVTLKHTGKLPKTTMGHNFVLTKAGAFDQVAKEWSAAGAANEWSKANDPNVIAHTKLLGGGESDTITISTTSLKGEKLRFLCTFPGHWPIMNGTFIVN